MATPPPDGHTGQILTREGDPPVAQTPTRTAAPAGADREPRSWVGYALIGGAVVLLVAGVLLLRPLFSSPTPQPTPAPPKASVTSPSAQEQAAADTEKILRDWLTSYQQAVVTFDAAKLNKTLITPEALAPVTANFDNLRETDQSHPLTAKYTADIRKVVVGNYRPQTMSLTVCALRDVRFFRDGQDVTITRDRQPAPVATQPKWQDTEFTRTDNNTWVISKFNIDVEDGPAC